MRVGILMPPKLKTDFGTKVRSELFRSGITSLGILHEFINLDYIRMEYGEKKQTKIFYKQKQLDDFDVMFNLLHNPDEPLPYLFLKMLEEINVSVINPLQASVHTKFKPLVLQMLNSNGISTPKSIIIAKNFNLDIIIDYLGGFPIILKTPYGSRGVGISICESERNLRSVIQTLIPQMQMLILQEFLPESAGTDFKIIATKEQVICSFKRQASLPNEFRANVALGGIATPILIDEEMALLAKRVIKSLGLIVGSVDILHTCRGYLVIDVNDLPEFNISFNQIEFIEKDFASFFVAHLLSLVSSDFNKSLKDTQKNPRDNFSWSYCQNLLSNQVIIIDSSQKTEDGS